MREFVQGGKGVDAPLIGGDRFLADGFVGAANSEASVVSASRGVISSPSGLCTAPAAAAAAS